MGVFKNFLVANFGALKRYFTAIAAACSRRGLPLAFAHLSRAEHFAFYTVVRLGLPERLPLSPEDSGR